MAANPQRLYMSPEHYLALDRASDTKYEYLDGEAVALAGGSINHSRLAGNLFFLLTQALGTRGPCITYNSDIRVFVAKRQYVYPDVTVSCDENDHWGEQDTLTSPRLVVEVISPGTEAIDRGRKLNWYRNHPSIQEYMLINTRVQLIEMYSGGKPGEPWAYQTYSAHETLPLASLDISLAVDDVYAGLRIPLPDTLAQEEE
jgi:Uma2 family endonuclease